MNAKYFLIAAGALVVLTMTTISVIGFWQAGLLRRHSAERTEQPERVLSTEAPDPVAPRTGNSSARVDALERRIKSLEEQLAALREKPAVVSKPVRAADPPADPAALKALKDQIPALITAKDGKGMLKLMFELQALGSDGYPAAFDLMSRLIRDEDDLGLEYEDLPEALAGPLQKLAAWAMTNADSTPVDCRLKVAESLGDEQWASSRDMIDWILAEKDPRVAVQLSQSMAVGLSDDMIPDLILVAKKHPQDAEAVRAGLMPLSYLGTPSAQAELDRMMTDTNPIVRKEATMLHLWNHPPATGVFVSWDQDAEKALGLQRGDVIMSVDGMALESGDGWSRTQAGLKDSKETVSLTVFRDGRQVTSRVSAKSLSTYSGSFVRERP